MNPRKYNIDNESYEFLERFRTGFKKKCKVNKISQPKFSKSWLLPRLRKLAIEEATK